MIRSTYNITHVFFLFSRLPRRPGAVSPLRSGPAAARFRSLFGFPSLAAKNPEENLFAFARAHLAQRLQSELSGQPRGRAASVTAPVVRRVPPPRPRRGEEAPRHELVTGEGGVIRVGEDVPAERARQVLRKTPFSHPFILCGKQRFAHISFLSRSSF